MYLKGNRGEEKFKIKDRSEYKDFKEILKIIFDEEQFEKNKNRPILELIKK